MANYFNTLSLREQLAQLGKCDFMNPSEFSDGVNVLRGKKLVVLVGQRRALGIALRNADAGGRCSKLADWLRGGAQEPGL